MPEAQQRIRGRLNVAGVEFQVIDFPPEEFPLGVDLMVQRPGALELVERIAILRGSILAIMNPDQAAKMRGEIRKRVKPEANGPASVRGG